MEWQPIFLSRLFRRVESWRLMIENDELSVTLGGQTYCPPRIVTRKILVVPLRQGTQNFFLPAKSTKYLLPIFGECGVCRDRHLITVRTSISDLV